MTQLERERAELIVTMRRALRAAWLMEIRPQVMALYRKNNRATPESIAARLGIEVWEAEISILKTIGMRRFVQYACRCRGVPCGHLPSTRALESVVS